MKTIFFFLAGIIFPVAANAQIINEVFISPTSKQWVEIYNDTSSGIDLTQYKILDSGASVNGHSISVVTGPAILPVGAYAVVAKDPATVNATYLFKSALGIKTTGDTVGLKKDSTTVDSVVIPENSDVENESYQKIDSSWIFSSATPGYVNALGSEKFIDTGSTYSAGSSTSAHFSAIPTSHTRSVSILGLGAGRERIAAFGTPLEFRIETNLAYKNRNNFVWNFGDGNEGYGEVITHTYEYPGDYTVVLNAVFEKGLAVSRTSVRVISPEIIVINADEKRIEIKNNSSEEVNLMGRALVSGERYFLFPKDTIVGGNQTISLSSNTTGLKPADKNSVFIVVVGETNLLDMVSKIEEEKQTRITYLQSQIETLLHKLSTLSVN